MNNMFLDSTFLAENFELLAIYVAEKESKRTHCYYLDKTVININQRQVSD